MQRRDPLVSSTEVKLIAVGIAFLALASCWAMPLKMLFGEGGSYYTFAVVGDEMIYANRMQPLAVGATIQNPINGVCDPQVTSPYFLEDVVREVVTLSGLHIITFFWVWRFIFPPVFLGCLCVLVWAVLPRRHATWPLVVIAAGAIQAMFFILYALIVPYPPMGGWILRIPTNIEYPFAALLCACIWRFAQSRRLMWGFLSAFALSLLVYLRPYSGLPWCMAALLALLNMLIRKELSIRKAFVITASLLGCLAPLAYVVVHNGSLPSYRETMERYFKPMDYEVHSLALHFIAVAIVLLVATSKMHRRFRVLMAASAVTMLLLPFVSGAPRTMRAELLLFDRYSPFYFVMIGAAAVGVLHKLTLSRQVMRTILAGAALSLTALTIRHGTYDYDNYYCGCYGYLRNDLKSVPAYDWLREHTPDDALVLTDERIHWGALNWTRWYDGLRATWTEDLFQVVAHRRPVYHWRMYGCLMSNEQYAQLVWLQRATFGMTLPDEAAADRTYAKLLAWYRPGYIFWRKGRPGLRGRGERLRKIANIEYSDEACEIWKLNYPEPIVKNPAAATPQELLDTAGGPQSPAETR